jgi:hypothetical protein
MRLGYQKHHCSAAAGTAISNQDDPKYPLVVRTLADWDPTRYLGTRPLALSVHIDRSATSQSMCRIIELDKTFVYPMPTIVAPPNSAPKQFARYGSTGN